MSPNGPAPLARRLPLRGQPRVLLNAIGRGDPETLNFDNPDPFAEGIDLVRGRTLAMKIDHVLSNGFGLGGVNASVVLPKM
jgi:3-oxoacyl-(acyl-carrier-protein) synthase